MIDYFFPLSYLTYHGMREAGFAPWQCAEFVVVLDSESNQ